jgi:hypothetical protein
MLLFAENAVVIATSGLSLRESPGQKNRLICKLSNGAMVEVVAKTGPKETIEGIAGQWFKVRAGSDEGWVFSGYLRAPSAKDLSRDNLNTNTASTLMEIRGENNYLA